MDITLEALNRLVGKSFTLFDVVDLNIYMMFVSSPVPFYMVKTVNGGTLYQVGAVELLTLLESMAPELIDLVLM